MGEQPRLTTFWFSDVEGSTRLLAEVGDEAYRALLREHRIVVRAAFASYGGEEVGTEGDSFFATFPSPASAASAAQEVQRALGEGPVRVRIGIHAGLALAEEGGYVGLDVHRAARIAGVVHGGQAVLSETARAHVAGDVVDLGQHRLKDLSAPVRLFQLGGGSFPALRSLNRTNLPVPFTLFLGRDRELADTSALLGRDDVRVVTLTGPGGMGKTRLALQAAAAAADAFADGVWWIPLAALEDPSLVLPTIAQTLQLGRAGGEAAAAALAQGLSGRRALIVIDNAEHLLPGVADAIAHLAAIDGPRLCVTSRERLALPGEHVLAVPSMSDADSVTLFVARARQLDPAFEEVPELAELCRQLDNLPLAIELAAARSSLFTVGELAERLGRSLDLLKAGRAGEERHRTLQAAVDWSYRLLSSEEQRVFRALAVFRGGCTVDALERVAGTDPDTIGSLLDKSLVRRRDGHGGPRLFMLETVRQHAAQLLTGDPEHAALAAASARYFTELTEQAFVRVTSFGTDGDRWWGSMRDERDNVRASLAFQHAGGDAESLARLCAGEWLLWFFLGDADEGAQWLRRSLQLGPPEHLLSAVENAYSAVLLVSGHGTPAKEVAADAVQHARESGDRHAESAALITLANALSVEDEAAAVAAWSDAAAVAREAGDAWWEACALANIAQLALTKADHAEAARLCERLEQLDGGMPNVIIELDLFRAEVAFVEGDVDRARTPLVRALQSRRRNVLSAAYDEIELAAQIVAGEGRLEQATILIEAATARHAELALRIPESWRERGAALRARLAAELGPEGFAEASERGRLLSLDQAIASAIELLKDTRRRAC